MKKFDGKTVIVTGGGGGIGGATCRRFAAEGAKVAVYDLNLSRRRGRGPGDHGRWRKRRRLPLRHHRPRQRGRRRGRHRCATRAHRRAGEQRRLGRVQALHQDQRRREWDKLIAINLTGALHMHHAVLPGMAARKTGRIVNIASDAGRVGSSGEAVYAACKGGLIAFSKTIAREHARHGITVNVVCPGPTDTALFADYKEGAGNPEKLMEAFTRAIPLGRIGQPDDLPGAILFFASDDAAFVTGQVLSVSGGLTMNG